MKMKKSSLKKFAGIAMAGAFVLALSACGSQDNARKQVQSTTSSVDSVLQAQIDKAEGNSTDIQTDAAASQNAATYDGVNTLVNAEDIELPPSDVDVDLTKLNSTMVYSEVYDMMYYPEKYVGKSIRMEGLYSFFHDETTGNDYHACYIADASACCAQGIEFVLNDSYTYPGDYPEVNEDIVVSGVFDTYFEDEYQYVTLRNAVLE